MFHSTVTSYHSQPLFKIKLRSMVVNPHIYAAWIVAKIVGSMSVRCRPATTQALELKHLAATVIRRGLESLSNSSPTIPFRKLVVSIMARI